MNAPMSQQRLINSTFTDFKALSRELLMVSNSIEKPINSTFSSIVSDQKKLFSWNYHLHVKLRKLRKLPLKYYFR